MSGFGEFLINNMKPSLEPEDLKLISRGLCNSYRNISNEYTSDSNERYSDDFGDGKDDEDGSFSLESGAIIRNEPFLSNEYSSEYEHFEKNNQNKQKKQVKMNSKPPIALTKDKFKNTHNLNVDEQESINNKSVSYGQSWRNLASKYYPNTSQNEKSKTLGLINRFMSPDATLRNFVSKTIEKTKTLKIASYEKNVNTVKSANSNVNNSLNRIKLKSNVGKRNCEKEGLLDNSLNSRKVTTNPIYESDTKLNADSDFSSSSESISNRHENYTQFNKKSTNQDSDSESKDSKDYDKLNNKNVHQRKRLARNFSSQPPSDLNRSKISHLDINRKKINQNTLKPTVVFEINQLLVENDCRIVENGKLTNKQNSSNIKAVNNDKRLSVFSSTSPSLSSSLSKSSSISGQKIDDQSDDSYNIFKAIKAFKIVFTKKQRLDKLNKKNERKKLIPKSKLKNNRKSINYKNKQKKSSITTSSSSSSAALQHANPSLNASKKGKLINSKFLLRRRQNDNSTFKRKSLLIKRASKINRKEKMSNKKHSIDDLSLRCKEETKMKSKNKLFKPFNMNKKHVDKVEEKVEELENIYSSNNKNSNEHKRDYQYRSKVIPIRVNLDPSDEIPKTSKTLLNSQNKITPISSSNALDKGKIKNREKLMQSWDKIIKKTSDDPKCLQEILKKSKRSDENNLKNKSEISTKMFHVNPSNDSKEKNYHIHNPFSNVGRFFKLNKNLNKKDNYKLNESNQIEEKKLKKEHQNKKNHYVECEDRVEKNKKPEINTIKDGEIIKDLFSYLNNYGDDGLTIKFKQMNVKQEFVESKLDNKESLEKANKKTNMLKKLTPSSKNNAKKSNKQEAKRILDKKANDKYSNIPNYFKCCVDKNSASTLSSRQFGLNDSSNSTSHLIKNISNPTKTTCTETGGVDFSHSIDIDTLIKSLDDDGQVELLKKKLSMYIKSKKTFTNNEPTITTENSQSETTTKSFEESQPVSQSNKNTETVASDTENVESIYDNKNHDMKYISRQPNPESEPKIMVETPKKIIQPKRESPKLMIKNENTIKSDSDMEMFYFRPETPTKRTLMKNRTQNFFKGIYKHLNNNENDKNEKIITQEPEPIRKKAESTFYLHASQSEVSEINNQANVNMHKYQHQNVFKTLFKSKNFKTLKPTCKICQKQKNECKCSKHSQTKAKQKPRSNRTTNELHSSTSSISTQNNDEDNELRRSRPNSERCGSNNKINKVMGQQKSSKTMPKPKPNTKLIRKKREVRTCSKKVKTRMKKQPRVLSNPEQSPKTSKQLLKEISLMANKQKNHKSNGDLLQTETIVINNEDTLSRSSAMISTFSSKIFQSKTKPKTIGKFTSNK